MGINDFLQFTIDREASDLHLVAGNYPAVRVNGVLYKISSLPFLEKAYIRDLILSFLNDDQKNDLLSNKEIDLGYQYTDYRFRVNVYFGRGSLNASFRLIPSKIRTIDELMIPQTFHNFSDLNSGLVLVTGPTGEGKSTTLASIINEINLKHSKHIITVEDPIEFIYSNGKCVVSQRELHNDTHSWSKSLRSALREDPDVVLVGEMRDYESTQLVLTIAETGHLVFSTLHTISAPESINRIIDIFPAHQQNQIKTQLSTVLKAVVSQRLLPRADLPGRIPAFEVLYNTSSVASIIREGKPYLLDNVLQTSEKEGFIIMEKYLLNLYREGKISKETAMGSAIRPANMEKLLKV